MRPCILGSLLDAAAHGLRKLSGIHLEQLPRMARLHRMRNSVLVRRHLARAHRANRRAAIEDLIDRDRVATRVRQIMANRSMRTGSMPVAIYRVPISERGYGVAKDPGPSPVACLVHTHSFGHSVATSPSR
jgi:hypothetical protein